MAVLTMQQVAELRERIRLRETLETRGLLRRLIDFLKTTDLSGVEAILDWLLEMFGSAAALGSDDAVWIDAQLRAVCEAPAETGAGFTGQGAIPQAAPSLVEPAAVGDFIRIAKKIIALLSLFGINLPIPGLAAGEPAPADAAGVGDSVAAEKAPAGDDTPPATDAT